jgi:hypothetical protein
MRLSFRTSPRDDTSSSNEGRNFSQESTSMVSEPFMLPTQSKTSQHLSSLSTTSSNPNHVSTDRNWQSYVQQQYQHLSNSFGSRVPRSGHPSSGSITQGSPISPSARSSSELHQYQTALNNQLVNPRYSYHMSKSMSVIASYKIPIIRFI